MGLDIVTNTMATEASNDISTNQSNMQSSLEKLSSGYQINSPADDASGYVISQHLQAQIGGFQQAQANTQAGINVVQTADGALNEVSSILQRINTLAVQSANTSATDLTAQQAAQSEVEQALTSIGDIAQTTVYGNKQLLVNGTSATVNFTFQVGNDNTTSSQVTFSVTALNLANLGLVTDSLDVPSGASSSGISGITASGAALNTSFNVTTTAGSAPDALDSSAVQGYASSSFVTGGNALTFTVSVDGGTTVTVSLAANTTFSMASLAYNITTDLGAAGYSASAVSVTYNTTGGTFAITDSSVGGSIAIGGLTNNLTSVGLSATTLMGTAATVVVTSGGNSATVNLSATQDVSGGAVGVTLGGVSLTLNLSGALSATSFLATADYNGGADMNKVNFFITSSTAVQTISNAIDAVSSIGGTLGAVQNELTDVSNNESVMIQNLQSSNAQIMDTNMASQMVSFTQDQTLVQAGVSMLAQANQIPSYVLKLLG